MLSNFVGRPGAIRCQGIFRHSHDQLWCRIWMVMLFKPCVRWCNTRANVESVSHMTPISYNTLIPSRFESPFPQNIQNTIHVSGLLSHWKNAGELLSLQLTGFVGPQKQSIFVFLRYLHFKHKYVFIYPIFHFNTYLIKSTLVGRRHQAITLANVNPDLCCIWCH